MRMGYGSGVRGGSGRGNKKKKKKTRPTVQLNRIIGNSIVKDTYLETFLGPDASTEVKQAVDFESTDPESMFSNRYHIWFADKMPSDRSVVFLFPNHPTQKLRTLRVSKISSLDSLGRAINTRFKESHEVTERGGNVRIAMAYGDHIYVFCNVTGTIYLAWARQITKKVGHISTNVGHNCPVILNMTGSLVGKSVFLPKQNVEDDSDVQIVMCSIKQDGDGTLRAGKWPKMYIKTSMIPALFVCEEDTRTPAKTRLKGMTEEEVLSRMASTSGGASRNKAARRERRANPFASSIDQEEELEDIYQGEEYGDDDDSSSSMEILPMHRSTVGGHVIHEDGTRSLGDLTLGRVRSNPPSIYSVVKEQPITDPGVPDCGTHRPRTSGPLDMTSATMIRGRKGSLSVIAASSGEESDETSTPTNSGSTTPHSGGTRSTAYVEMNPWDSSSEEGEEEEEEDQDAERASLTKSHAGGME